MKEQLCELFCDSISVQEVPAGYAVSTAFSREDGDSVGFYVVPSPTEPGLARLEDDGQTIPLLEVSGVDFSGETRGAALAELLSQCGARIDHDESLIHTDFVPIRDVPRIALRFVELLIRLQDFSLLTKERVESTFRDDVRSEIRAVMPDLKVTEREAITPELREFEADFVIRDNGHAPLGVFLGYSDERVLNAIVAKMAAEHEAKAPCSVVALLEWEGSVSKKLRQMAANRLDGVPIFRGEERQSVVRIRQELQKRELRAVS
jgi:hypothetical protein